MKTRTVSLMFLRRCIAVALLGWTCAASAGEAMLELDRASAQRLGDPATYTGPTVVALWSLTCTHCKKHLQQLAELARADPRVQIRTVAVEPAEDEHGALLDRMAIPGARYAYGDGVAEALAHALDPHWRGELPRTLYFDGRGGKLARSGVTDAAAILGLLGLARPAALLPPRRAAAAPGGAEGSAAGGRHAVR